MGISAKSTNVSLASISTNSFKEAGDYKVNANTLIETRNLISYDEVRPFQKNELVFVESYSSIKKSDFGETSFYGFRVDEKLMENFVVRRVEYEFKYGKPIPTRRNFKENWDIEDETGTIRLPRSGTYIVFMTACHSGGQFSNGNYYAAMLSLKMNYEDVISLKYINCEPNVRSWVMSGVVLFNGEEGGEIALEFTGLDLVTLHLLLYAPEHGKYVAWFLHCKPNGKQSKCFKEIDMGRQLNENEKTETISRSGIYFVSLTVLSSLLTSQYAYVSLNGQYNVISIPISAKFINESSKLGPIDIVSTSYQSTLIELSTNDKLSVGSLAPTNTEFFIGFLVLPI